MASFTEKLLQASSVNRTLLCVGLDPDPYLMAIPDIFEFNKAIVDSTKDLVCAYQPNLAFYEVGGSKGIIALEKTVEHIRAVAPDAILIGDGKRGDIGSTSTQYARAMFDTWGFDATTVNAWGGGEGLEPFLKYEDRGVFVWCRSSNAGAAEFQDLEVKTADGVGQLFEVVATRAIHWKSKGTVGLVVGATYPGELRTVRAASPTAPILAPGVGAQAGDLKATVIAGVDGKGRNLIISASRGVSYASRDRANFETAANAAAEKLRKEINDILHEVGKGW